MKLSWLREMGYDGRVPIGMTVESPYPENPEDDAGKYRSADEGDDVIHHNLLCHPTPRAKPVAA